MDYQTPEFAKFEALSTERAQLASAVENASEFTKDLYEKGITEAERRMEDLRKAPAFAAAVASLYLPFENAFKELDELLPAVQQGLVSAEIVAARRESLEDQIKQSPDLQLAQSLYAGGILTSTEVALDLVEEPEDSLPDVSINSNSTSEQETSAEKLSKHLEITVFGDAVQIGKSGKYVKASNTAHKGQINHAKDRLRLLGVLCDNAGSSMSVHDLWEEAFPGREFDGNVMTQAKAWFLKQLTYRNQPIVEFNGKRGLGSAYGIVNFDVTVVKKAAGRQKSSGPVYSVKGPKTEVAEPALATAETADKMPSTNFPLSGHESLIIAEFLRFNKDFMQEINLTPIPQSIVDELQQFRDETARDQLIRDYNTVQKARVEMLEKLDSFFKDELKVMETIAEMDVNDPLYPFYEYLFSLEGDDRFDLLQRLATAERGTIAVTDGSKFGSNSLVDTRRVIRLNGFPELLSNVLPKVVETPVVTIPVALLDQVNAAQELITSIDDPKLEAITSDNEDTPEIVSELKSTEVMTPMTQDEQSQTVEPNKAEKEAIKWKIFKHDVGKAIDSLEKDGLMIPGGITANKISSRRSSAKLGTKTSLTRLLQANLIKLPNVRNESQLTNVEMDAPMLVMSWLYNIHQHGVLGKNNKHAQKQAVKIINDAVASYFEKRKLED